MAEKKYGAKDKKPIPMELPKKSPAKRNEKSPAAETKTKTLKRSETEKDSHIKRNTTQTESNGIGGYHREFRLGDGGSHLASDKFSEDPSLHRIATTKEEKKILDNIKPSPEKKNLEKAQLSKQVSKHQEQKKKLQDVIGPVEFNIKDDREEDPTEGFESVEGANDSDKRKLKEGHKQMKQAFKSKVADYKEHKPINTKLSSDKGYVNPKEFVLGDDISMASDAEGFAEKERPQYSESADHEHEKSVALQSFTEIRDEEESFREQEEQSDHFEGDIDPKEFKIADGKLKKYDEVDFSDNSKSN
jgi:hypothetical protein